jgi:predicted small lipoprotein YifL
MKKEGVFMRRLLGYIFVLLFIVSLAGCGGSGEAKSTATPEPSVSQEPETATDTGATDVNETDVVQSTEQAASEITGCIESKDGVFLISRDQYISQLDYILKNSGLKALSDYDASTGEKDGPNGEKFDFVRYDVDDGVMLALCTGKNDDKLTEIMLFGVLKELTEESKDTFSAYGGYNVALIDNADSESILYSLGEHKGGEVTVEGKNASYTFAESDGVACILISPVN